uniref:Uncharacterized protein n=1 Tax=Bionectria ochroleuca TaxID=29856 RepID=A0A8H7N2K8_BIOOC
MSPKKDKGTNRNEQQRQQDAAHALIQMANGNRRQRREFLELMTRATPLRLQRVSQKFLLKRTRGPTEANNRGSKMQHML